ncbi:hypothetical protein AX14_006606 [Amanita brunnescens Koide BX004]|nr:hypothetical protein AX14_006606 [Amanita brunnescens Koide BX004]
MGEPRWTLQADCYYASRPKPTIDVSERHASGSLPPKKWTPGRKSSTPATRAPAEPYRYSRTTDRTRDRRRVDLSLPLAPRLASLSRSGSRCQANGKKGRRMGQASAQYSWTRRRHRGGGLNMSPLCSAIPLRLPGRTADPTSASSSPGTGSKGSD